MRWQEPAFAVIGLLCFVFPQVGHAHPDFVVLWGDVADQGPLPSIGALPRLGQISIYEEPDWSPGSVVWSDQRLITPLDGSPTQYQGASGACSPVSGGFHGSNFYHLAAVSPTVATALIVTSEPVVSIAHSGGCMQLYENGSAFPSVFPGGVGRGLEADDLVVFDSTRHVMAVQWGINGPTDVDGLRAFVDVPATTSTWIGFQCLDAVVEASNRVRFGTSLDLNRIDDDDAFQRYNVVVELPGAADCEFGGNPCEKVLDAYFFCTRSAELEEGERDETALRCAGDDLRSGRAVAVTDGRLGDIRSVGGTPSCELRIGMTPGVDGGVGSVDAAVPNDASMPADASVPADASTVLDAGNGRVDSGLDASRTDGAATRDSASRPLDSGDELSGVQFVGGGGCGCDAAASSGATTTGLVFGLVWLIGVLRRRPRKL